MSISSASRNSGRNTLPSIVRLTPWPSLHLGESPVAASLHHLQGSSPKQLGRIQCDPHLVSRRFAPTTPSNRGKIVCLYAKRSQLDFKLNEQQSPLEALSVLFSPWHGLGPHYSAKDKVTVPEFSPKLGVDMVAHMGSRRVLFPSFEQCRHFFRYALRQTQYRLVGRSSHNVAAVCRQLPEQISK